MSCKMMYLTRIVFNGQTALSFIPMVKTVLLSAVSVQFNNPGMGHHFYSSNVDSLSDSNKDLAQMAAVSSRFHILAW